MLTNLRNRFLGVLLVSIAGLAAAESPQPPPVSFLTGPSAADPLDIALGYIWAEPHALGLRRADMDEFVIADRHMSHHTGTTHIVLRQRMNGIEVWNGDLSINVSGGGSVINAHNRFVARPQVSARSLSRLRRK